MWHVAEITILLAVALDPHPVAQLDTVRVEAAADVGILKPVPFPDLPASLVEVLRQPHQVTAVLVHGDTRDGPENSDTFGYARRSSTVDVPDSLGRRLGDLILSQQNYNTGEKACIFWPNIAYILEGVCGGVVHVAVCHGCASIWLRRRDRTSTFTFRDIDRVNLPLIGIGLALFPADTTLQARYGKALKHPER